MSDIDWTENAIAAAAQTLRADLKDSVWLTDAEIRAALNAAVAKQFHRAADLPMVFAYEGGYRDGVTDAAKIAQTRYVGDNNREDMEAQRIAAAIRKLLPGDAP